MLVQAKVDAINADIGKLFGLFYFWHFLLVLIYGFSLCM
jgi:hypothetical protein